MNSQTQLDDNLPVDDNLPDAVNRSINRHAMYSAGAVLIPIPMIEVVTNTTMQIHLIARLCDLYQVRFSQHAVKASIATFVGVVLPTGKIGVAAYLTARAVPVVGPILGLTTAPVLAGAMTWAIGRVFAWHFEHGGSLDDFQADDAIARFKQEFSEGKRRARDLMHPEKSSAESNPTHQVREQTKDTLSSEH